MAILGKHPHGYEWHDGHTDHYKPVRSVASIRTMAWAKTPMAPPVGLLKADLPNDQAAGVGVGTYARFAGPYGKVLGQQQPSMLKHYRYEGKSAHVDDLVHKHGYQVYYAGGKYGKPDLTKKNYNTGHLMIYDPDAGSGGDFGERSYTDAWRKTHELAHALTYPELNKIYGEGRRIGKLGTHRTLNEAMRAVHWEHLAAHKQRELSAQIGVHMSDEDFNKEYNTVMHDAVHRAVTGQFTEPSAEGFHPHSHAVPLSTALDMVRDEGSKMGLKNPHQTLKKGWPMDPTKPVGHDLDPELKSKYSAHARSSQELAEGKVTGLPQYSEDDKVGHTLNAIRTRAISEANKFKPGQPLQVDPGQKANAGQRAAAKDFQALPMETKVMADQMNQQGFVPEAPPKFKPEPNPALGSGFGGGVSGLRSRALARKAYIHNDASLQAMLTPEQDVRDQDGLEHPFLAGNEPASMHHAKPWSGAVPKKTRNNIPTAPKQISEAHEKTYWQGIDRASMGKSELTKGDVVQFPGNPAPAKDLGQPASVREMHPGTECQQCLHGASRLLQGGVPEDLYRAIGPQSSAIFKQKYPNTNDPAAHKALAILMHARHGFQKSEPEHIHEDVDSFWKMLQTMDGPEQGAFIARHMGHEPFKATLKRHPQGEQIKNLLSGHTEKAELGAKPAPYQPMSTADMDGMKKLFASIPPKPAVAIPSGKPTAAASPRALASPKAMGAVPKIGAAPVTVPGYNQTETKGLQAVLAAAPRIPGRLGKNEPLAKRSKNVREKTRNIGTLTAHQRIMSYLKTRQNVNSVDYKGKHLMGVKATPEGLDVTAGVAGFPPEHELGHALMTPQGESMANYLKDLGPPPGVVAPSVDVKGFPPRVEPAEEKRREAEEHAATTVQMNMYRRAGTRVPESEADNRRLEANPTWRVPSEQFKAGVAAGKAKTAALDEGRQALNPKTGVMEPGQGIHAKINARAQPIAKSQPPVILPEQGTTMAEILYTPAQAAEILKKAAKDKILALELQLQDLRKKELSKAIVPPHKHNQGTTVGVGTEDVPYGKINPPGVDKAERVPGMSPTPFVPKPKPASQPIKKEELCKACGKSHGMEKGCMGKAELVDSNGVPKESKEHPQASMPPEGGGKEVKVGRGTGGKISKSPIQMRKDALEMAAKKDTKGDKKPPKPVVIYGVQPDSERKAELDKNAPEGIRPEVKESMDRAIASYAGKKPAPVAAPKPVVKAQPPMAKPPSGTAMATAVPTSAPKSPAPKAAGLGKGVMSDIAQKNQPPRPQPAAGLAPAKMPTPDQHAQRAAGHQAALNGAFQPTGPVTSGLELASPKAAGVTPQVTKPGIFGRLGKFGK